MMAGWPSAAQQYWVFERNLHNNGDYQDCHILYNEPCTDLVRLNPPHSTEETPENYGTRQPGGRGWGRAYRRTTYR